MSSSPWVFQPHCVIFLIGPSQSGKTTLCRYLLEQCEEQLGKGSCLYLSSDKIRDRLNSGVESGDWQPRADKYSARMMNLSDAAFKILTAEYTAALQYPCAKPVILLDTTGLSETFRQPMLELARQHAYFTYALVFDLGLQVYTEMNLPSAKKDLLVRQQTRLRHDVLPTLKKFHTAYRIHHRPPVWSQQPITFQGAALLRQCQVDAHLTWYIIGDIHASLDPLFAVLQKLPGVTLDEEKRLHLRDDCGIILAGDLVDKGNQLGPLLEWLQPYLDHPRFKIVRGNHEQRVMNRLTQPSEEEATTVFQDHAQVLAQSPEWRTLFERVFAVTLPFVQAQGRLMNDNEFIVTHAPCESKYLGKVDHRSQARQRYWAYDRQDQYQSVATFLQEHQGPSSVWHIFGHVPVAEPRCLGKCIALDTGCGMGGRLTAVTVKHQRPRFFTVPDTTSQPLPGAPPLINIPLTSVQKPSEQKEDPRSKTRLDHLQRHHINFISGTVSPAAASTDNLEALEQALAYFRKKQCQRVVLQPKYMGSRCQVYLCPPQPQDSYAVSRNGYLIRFPPAEEARFQEICRDLAIRVEKLYPGAKLAILDGELLPWSYLGQGLIDDFERYGVASAGHQEFLQEYGFPSVVTQEQSWHLEFRQTYQPDQSKKVELVKRLQSEKRGHWLSKYHALTSLFALTSLATWEEQRVALATYQQQLALYGKPMTSPNDLEFAPFDLLKVITAQDEELVLPLPRDQAFAALQDDAQCVIDIGDVASAQAFFDQCVSRHLEGVVVKPLDGHPEVPFLKVRNPHYLSLIYGPLYQHVPDFIKKKSIGRRLKDSEVEWNLGLKMLQRPYHQLDTDTEHRALLNEFLAYDGSTVNVTDARL